MAETRAKPGLKVPTLKRAMITWIIRVAIAAALVWGWLAWQGGPDWLWTALAIYAVVSLVLALVLRVVAQRMAARLAGRVEGIERDR